MNNPYNQAVKYAHCVCRIAFSINCLRKALMSAIGRLLPVDGGEIQPPTGSFFQQLGGSAFASKIISSLS
jgi:hypothetical protein